MRPLLARDLYPGCDFRLLGNSRELTRRFSRLDRADSGCVYTDYGGTLCLPTPSGTVYAHDFTEDKSDGDNTDFFLDWVIFELALPPSSPWYEAGYARIECAGPLRPDERGSSPISDMGRKMLRGIRRAFLGSGLKAAEPAGQPLFLFSDNPERHRRLLEDGPGRRVLDFFARAGWKNIVIFDGRTLYVLAEGRSMDQRWKARRPDFVKIQENAAEVVACSTISKPWCNGGRDGEFCAALRDGGRSRPDSRPSGSDAA